MDLNWAGLVQPHQTVVFYMGLSGVKHLSAKLIENGMAENMPAALVQQGTTPKQRVFVSTIKGLPQLVEETKVKPPTLIIVGEVVKLHDQLKWFNAENL